MEEKEKVEEVVEEVVTEEAKESVESLKEEINSWKKEYALKLADFENYKKRKDKEFEEFKKYASEGLILEQLSSLDILLRAVEMTEVKDETKALVDGINMVLSNMMNSLKSHGVEEIQNEGIYDPYLHQAMLTESVEDKEEGEILQVLQKGYKLKGKVIRPSMVKINKK